MAVDRLRCQHAHFVYIASVCSPNQRTFSAHSPNNSATRVNPEWRFVCFGVSVFFVYIMASDEDTIMAHPFTCTSLNICNLRRTYKHINRNALSLSHTANPTLTYANEMLYVPNNIRRLVRGVVAFVVWSTLSVNTVSRESTPHHTQSTLRWPRWRRRLWVCFCVRVVVSSYFV